MAKKENLFKIGEITNLLDVTRKTLLYYEDIGLITPAYKNPKSGYRYYSADNITQIRSIRDLQNIGLSLQEISEYYYDIHNIDKHLEKLYALRATLDKNIQMMQVRSAKADDFTVKKTVLSRTVYYCKKYPFTNTADITNKLRDTYIEAAKTGQMSSILRMFTMRLGYTQEASEVLCCIPMEPGFNGLEAMEFPETSALCIYYRGPYEGLHKPTKALYDYVEQNKIEATGYCRNIFIEGPPSRGANSEDYITQVAIPISSWLIDTEFP